MAELRRVTVEFDKNKENGKVYVEFSTVLLEPQDQMVLLAKVKEKAGLALVKDGFSWSHLFKVTRAPFYHIGHTWLDLELDLLRVNKPPEWNEEYYENQITDYVLHLCNFVMYQIDSLEEDILQSRLPEVKWSTSQF